MTCVNAHFFSPEWVNEMLDLEGPMSAPEPLGWPVGTLVHHKANGRRGSIFRSNGNAVQIAFNDDAWDLWTTTWDVVLRNYQPIQ